MEIGIPNCAVAPARPRRATRRVPIQRQKASNSRCPDDNIGTTKKARCDREKGAPPNQDPGQKSTLLHALQTSTSPDSVASCMITNFLKSRTKISNKCNSSDNANTSSSSPLATTSATAGPPLTLLSLHSPSANKSQLRAKFHELYYATDITSSFSPSRWLMFQSGDSQNALTRLSEHALHLTQLGTISGDARVERDALRAYQNAVVGLRKRLSCAVAVEEDVFVVVQLLSQCATYRNISDSDLQGRRRHVLGLGELLAAKGVRFLTSYPLRIALFIYQAEGLVEGLVRRKRVRFGEKRWLRLLKENRCKWRIPELLMFVLEIPGLLEKVDGVLQGGGVEQSEVVGTLSEVEMCSKELRAWMDEWCRDVEHLPARKMPVRDCEWLRPLDAMDQMTFNEAFDFGGTASAKAHELFWMSLLALTEATRDLAALLHDHDFPRMDAKHFSNTIVKYADNLCMSALYMAKPENGMEGCINACRCIQFAAITYEKSGAMEKQTWCKKVVNGIERVAGILAPGIERK